MKLTFLSKLSLGIKQETGIFIDGSINNIGASTETGGYLLYTVKRLWNSKCDLSCLKLPIYHVMCHFSKQLIYLKSNIPTHE